MDKLISMDEPVTHNNTFAYSYHWIECMCEQCEQLGHGMFSIRGEHNDK